MNKSDYFDAANKSAMGEFSHYDGWSSFDDPYNYATGQVGQVNSNANPAASIPYVFNIANSTTVDVASVVILGANENTVGATNNGNAASITITLQGTLTYAAFLESIKSVSFRTGKIQLQSANADQPFQLLTFVNKDANGRTLNTPVVPVLDPMQNQANVTIIEHQFVVDGWFEIQTTILASATLVVRLYPMAEVSMARSLNGRSVEKIYGNTNISQYKGGLIG